MKLVTLFNELSRDENWALVQSLTYETRIEIRFISPNHGHLVALTGTVTSMLDQDKTIALRLDDDTEDDEPITIMINVNSVMEVRLRSVLTR